MRIIPLPHYNFATKIFGRKKNENVLESPPPPFSVLAQGSADDFTILPPLSKHPGAAPVFKYLILTKKAHISTIIALVKFSKIKKCK